MSEEIKLTEYSKGAGCGCKIPPAILHEILSSASPQPNFPALLVGNESKDDAAVYDLGDGTAIISTTDFFMPVVDDAFDFGRIASANAISDIYAMGGTPLMAVAILGWPIEKLPVSLAARVLEGSRAICSEAGIPLAGGHTIESGEPIFGLAVTGRVPIEFLKQNSKAKEGDLLFLTKPLGVGVLSTAQKRKLISAEHLSTMVMQMSELNKVGQLLGKLEGVTAMTDLTGFGLLGHLLEIAEGSGLGAEINYKEIKILPGVIDYLAQKAVPDATFKNWNSFSKKVQFAPGVNVMEAFNILSDPQTNGGLLFTVTPRSLKQVIAVLQENGLEDFIEPIGKMTSAGEKLIKVM